MTARQRLPARRASLSFDFETGGLKFVCTCSRFADGRIGEIFLTNRRANSQAGIMAIDQAVLASCAWQSGCPLETSIKALMRNRTGRATSPLGIALDRIADDGGPPGRHPPHQLRAAAPRHRVN